MTAFLVAVAVVGWLLVVLLARMASKGRQELREARRVAAIADDADLPAAIADERRESDERIQQAEAITSWLRAALDEASDAIVVVDRIGREILRNGAARSLEGARPGEVLADDAIGELLAQAILGISSERELQLYGPPRQVLQIRAIPLRRGGEVVGAVAFSRDISEARRVESVRRDFVANVSHELKTPIGALGLLAETLAATDDVGVVQQLADRVVREADRLARIVDDLLDLSTIEAQEAPTREPLPVPILIAEAVDLVQAAAAAAGVPLLIAPEPPDVEIPLIEIKSVKPQRGWWWHGFRIWDGSREHVFRVSRTLLLWRTREVRDDGVGFERCAARRLGLGLTSMVERARLLGGACTIESQPARGSRVRARLPLAGAALVAGD